MSSKPRTKFNEEQIYELERLYRFNDKPLREMMIDLGERVGLELRPIQIWFQNRRVKDRQQAAREKEANLAKELKHNFGHSLHSAHATNRTPYAPSLHDIKSGSGGIGSFLMSGLTNGKCSFERASYLTNMNHSRSFATHQSNNNCSTHNSYSEKPPLFNECSNINNLPPSYQDTFMDNNLGLDVNNNPEFGHNKDYLNSIDRNINSSNMQINIDVPMDANIISPSAVSMNININNSQRRVPNPKYNNSLDFNSVSFNSSVGSQYEFDQSYNISNSNHSSRGSFQMQNSLNRNMFQQHSLATRSNINRQNSLDQSMINNQVNRPSMARSTSFTNNFNGIPQHTMDISNPNSFEQHFYPNQYVSSMNMRMPLSQNNNFQNEFEKSNQISTSFFNVVNEDASLLYASQPGINGMNPADIAFGVTQNPFLSLGAQCDSISEGMGLTMSCSTYPTTF